MTNDEIDESIRLRLTYGNSQFLVQLGACCRLSLNDILTGLLLQHRFYKTVALKSVERKHVSAACLLLAWKFWEDREATRRPKKCLELLNGMYQICCDDEEGEGSHVVNPIVWQLRDLGAESRSTRDKMKIYEEVLLRTIDYALVPAELEPAIKYLPRIIDKCASSPRITGGPLSKEHLDRWLRLANATCVDFYSWPCCDDYDPLTIAKCIVFKCALALCLPVFELSTTPASDDQSQSDETPPQLRWAFEMSQPLMRRALMDLRRIYDWIEIAEEGAAGVT